MNMLKMILRLLTRLVRPRNNSAQWPDPWTASSVAQYLG